MPVKRFGLGLALGLSALTMAATPAQAQKSDRYPTMLKNTYWVIHTTPTPEGEVPKDAPPASEIGPRHLEYQFMLEETGVMFAAGPFAEPDGSPAGGLIVIRAADEAEARSIADNDPFHKSGLRRYTLNKWTVHEGQVRVTIDFSTGKYDFD